MTNNQIYKMYKHGQSFKHTGLTIQRIYNALKKSGLQVVMVFDEDNEPMIYNFIPEEGNFYYVFK